MPLILDGSLGVSGVDGSAGTPSLQGTDNNTGVFYGTDIVGISTGGSERMRITSGGSVGIANSTPAETFVVGNSTSDTRATFRPNTPYAIGVANGAGFAGWIGGSGAADTMVFSSAGGTERMRIDSSGNVGIGTSSPSYTLDVNGTIRSRAAGAEGGQIDFNNPDNNSIGLSVDVSSADNGRIFSARNNSILQIGQLVGTGGNIQLYTAAAERMRITSAGLVGIGTSSPNFNGATGTVCHINNAASGSWAATRYTTGNTGSAAAQGLIVGLIGIDSYLYNYNAGDLIIATSAQERMRIDSGGIISIARGASVSAYTSYRGNGLGAGNELFVGQGGDQIGYFYNRVGSPVVFGTSNAERMRINAAGNITIGKSNDDASGSGLIFAPNGATYATIVAGLNTYHVYSASSGTFRFYVNENGGIANFSGNNANLSDERTKKNIELAGGYLDKICAIPVKFFNYKQESDGEQKTLGVIAQDVEAVAPEFVSEGWEGATADDGSPLKTIYTTDMMFGMMKAIQEQQAIIQELTERIKKLEGA